MAIAELQKVNADREMRQLIEAREKARHDEATRFADAELRGKVLGLAEGIEKGRKESVALGRQEGIARGREEGVAEGIEKGRQEGVEAGRREAREKMILLAQRLLKVGTALAEIIEITGLSESEILATGGDSSNKNKVQEPARPFGRSRRKPAKS